MTKPTVKIIDLESGQEIEREMNAEELAQWEKDNAEVAAQIAEAEAKNAKRSELLTRLGITAEEAALLLA